MYTTVEFTEFVDAYFFVITFLFDQVAYVWMGLRGAYRPQMCLGTCMVFDCRAPEIGGTLVAELKERIN